MTKSQLSELFKKYLLRDYKDHEWNIHGNKEYNAFEKELQNCEEYRSLNFSKDKAENVQIKIAVASNKNFKDKSLPILLPKIGRAHV